MKKRIVLALVVATVLFAAVYASAASLNVNGAIIQQGDDANLKCTGTVDVAGWGLESDTGLVNFVRFEPLPSCEGVELFANVYDGGGARIAHGKVTLTSGSDSISFTGVPAESIERIELFLEGAD